MHTPIKSQNQAGENDRIAKPSTVQTTNMLSPIPNAFFSRDVWVEQGGKNVQRLDGYQLQQGLPSQHSRIQVITKTPQNVPTQSQNRTNIPTLNLGSTDPYQTITPNGSLPRTDPRRENAPSISQNQQSVSSSSNASPGFFSDVAFTQLGPNYPTLGSRKTSQAPEENGPTVASKSSFGPMSVVPAKATTTPQGQVVPSTPAFPAPPQIGPINPAGVYEIIRMNESKQAEDIITHNLPSAKDGSSQNQQNFPVTNNTQPVSQSQQKIKTPVIQTPNDLGVAGLLSPKSSLLHVASTETVRGTQTAAGLSTQSIQPRLTEMSQVAGELVRLNLEGIGSYEGIVRNNALNGYGKLLDSKGRLVYEGEFVDSQFMGLGVLYNHDSASDRLEARGSQSVPENWIRYEGLFYNNQKNGKGDLFYRDGGLFSGDFEGDLANGSGVLRVASGEAIRGVWKNGILVSRN
jgi:hypothetical protein